MVTIKEIADKLGVSPTTVSNVINGRTEKMSAETRTRIEEELWQNHYGSERIHFRASSDERMIVAAFYMKDKENVLLDPFCGELLGAAEAALHSYGRSLIYNVPGGEEALVRLFAPWNVEGGILLGFHPDECEIIMKKVSKPLVFVDSFFGEGLGLYDNVGLQDFEGAHELTGYLMKQGHRSIAFFCDQIHPLASNYQRFMGFQKAFTDSGFSFQGEDYYFLPPNKHHRHELLRQFIKSPVKHYSAAFFVSDYFASEAINIFSSQGFRVPDDISVTGFDDNIYARLSNPMLTTVRQSPTEKAREAVKILIQRIQGETAPPRSLKLPTELIVRDSVSYAVKPT